MSRLDRKCRRHRLSVGLTAIVLLFAISSIQASEGKRLGFVFGTGIGVAPASSWTGKERVWVKVPWGPSDSYFFDGRPNQYREVVQERSLDLAGATADLALGFGFTSRDIISYELSTLGHCEDYFGPRVFCGFYWYHFLKPVAGGPFVRIGTGQYCTEGPWPDEENAGRGYALGFGYELKSRVQMLLNVNSGSRLAEVGDDRYFGVSLTLRKFWY